MEEIEATIKGRVQMVMFRDFTQRRARGLRLSGFVRNNKDGTVTAVAQGKREDLLTFIEALKKGSLLSHVASVDVVWRKCAALYENFIIAY